MTFLPIVDRELRVRSRDKNTWRIRALAGAAASLVGAPLLLLSQSGTVGGLSGQQFFYFLTAFTMLFCLFEGARQTSDSISGERREGTLGLLFLTDLRGYDIVLGKLAVTSINSFFGLLAVFPSLSLGLLAGGITVGEFWRLSLALVTALLLSLAVGIWVSTRNTDERRAMLITAVLLGAVLGGLPLLDTLFGFGTGPGARAQPIFSLASPVSACFMAADWAYRAAPHHFWLSQMAILFCVVGLLLDAAISLSPVTASEQKVRAHTRPRRLAPGPSNIDRDPIAWLASANTTIPRGISALLLAGALVAIFRLYEVFSNPPAVGAVTFRTEIWMISIVISLLIWFMVAYLASDFFLQVRRTGLLELLLCAPQSSAALLRGHRRAMWTMLRGPAAIWLGTSLLGQLAGWLQLSSSGRSDLLLEMVISHIVGLVASGLTLVALTYAGAWFAVTSRKTAHALGKLITFVLLLPFIVANVLCPIVILNTTSWFLGVRIGTPLVTLMSAVFFIRWADNRLKSSFREAAVRQITGEPRPQLLEPVGEYFSLLRDPVTTGPKSAVPPRLR